ncbi:MAG: PHB depolymerase family esterase [Actinomycetota bacterium]
MVRHLKLALFLFVSLFLGACADGTTSEGGATTTTSGSTTGEDATDATDGAAGEADTDTDSAAGEAEPAEEAAPADGPEEGEPAGELDTAGCVVHDGIEYCHEAFTPDGVDAPAPLVIDLHGLNSSAQRQRAGSGFERLAADEGFTVVWPQGHDNSWNGGRRCCGTAAADDLDDIGYLRALVDEVSARHPVDPARVYATGLSNGCAMAQRLAADASDLVAAVGCMALYLLDEPDPGYQPVPVMELHGTDDRVVGYGTGPESGAEANFEAWAEHNGCSGSPVVEEGDGFQTTVHQACDGADVALVTVIGGGHALYQGMETSVDTSRLAWDFMRQFRR